MKSFTPNPARQSLAGILGLIVSLAWLIHAGAQPIITSTTPATGATGVSPSAAVVFRFSEQMDTALTTATFLDSTTFAQLPTTSAWSQNDTVLTCTPTPAFPAGKMIFWSVDGESLIGDPLGGTTAGYFTTSSGGGGGTGSGTNALTSFTVGKIHFYNQTNANAPALDSDVPYNFDAVTTLASNRSASAVTVALPTGSVSNLTQNFARHEMFYLFSSWTNLAGLNSTFPGGNYTFNVVGSTNQQVTVNLPVAFVQPNAPHISNFAAAQSINATRAFTLSWDAFQGGTASDFISVSVGNSFRSPDVGAAGALNGTATSIVIPAGTLQAGSNYSASIGFYRAAGSSNASYTTLAYLATTTDFTVAAAAGSTVTGALVFTNASWSAGTFSFDVTSAAGQTFTVEYSSTMVPNQWQTLRTTNSATGRAHFTHSTGNPYLFYRARTGL